MEIKGQLKNIGLEKLTRDIGAEDLALAYLKCEVEAALHDFARNYDIDLMKDTKYTLDSSLGELLTIISDLNVTYDFTVKEKSDEG